ncbi:MAG: hypothetical protein UY63_C0002G0030 [Parcubacteria group bacterium GW2011_GWA2_51_10]|nr:MAG: hypothetical protein UY63_C0002G0030 [Parcubacteria group bacterium GW2011_GWA2_51_10]
MTNSKTLNFSVAAAVAVAMALALLAFATTASAAVNSSSITITTTNRGTIDNYTSARSHTGNNTAEGSVGGVGGQGGDVTSDGDNNNGGATTGNGGNGGDGGAGGLVDTGDATAEAGTENDLNTSDVEVDLTTAGGDVNSTSVDVVTDNTQTGCDCPNNIDNRTKARAYSGDNDAKGSTGGDGERGGAISGGQGDFNNGGAGTGDGGDGGNGELGGTVFTGNASSTSATLNLLNTVILRVRI